MTYSYAYCVCGWQMDVTDEPAAELLAKHCPECQYPERALLVPMWSVAWPYYHSDESVAWRAGGPAPPFGLEMAWRAPGSHSLGDPFDPFKHGGMAKEWYLFAALEDKSHA